VSNVTSVTAPHEIFRVTIFSPSGWVIESPDCTRGVAFHEPSPAAEKEGLAEEEEEEEGVLGASGSRIFQRRKQVIDRWWRREQIPESRTVNLRSLSKLIAEKRWLKRGCDMNTEIKKDREGKIFWRVTDV
jgi:hypothetical protein